ncbi:hypothetical protein K7X08_023149 [Anisodus acutangulus]|uniref:MADS-box domain-containing protein n=1 Tax=Anisodus acutangulus TaxID=402998 RepID=A0A9Q1LI53_9SOLA|nr:hypothetical protein K7X08_023149 [Anisodus acutangulus]
MAEKKTLGRQKIPMAKIEKENDRYSTFSKRRSVNSVIDSFLSPHTQPSESNLLDAVNTRDKVKELKAKLDEFDLAKDDEYNQRPMPDETDQKKWWKSIKEFDAKEVKNYLIYLESTISGLENCLMLLEKGASSSAQAPPEDAN